MAVASGCVDGGDRWMRASSVGSELGTRCWMCGWQLLVDEAGRVMDGESY